ncbi:efflux RND transporter periplasmic adaptor subunit [Flexibacterium corallicola]|uniref:efflux RND transporter periplasmic adaptor subunit n=1 Tax=Flexibacterium corallicola TaxID=3037259 RepID=UPI00286F7869|nr:efflux RND transporter periplasmic adaptor subunit [Pseudovibrio sp. M1P-2-3]
MKDFFKKVRRERRAMPYFYKAALMVVGGSLLLAGCSEEKAEVVEEAQPRLAKVMVVSEEIGTATREFPGRIQPVQTVDLSFRVNGQLEQLPVRESQMVKKGELIAALDPSDYEAVLREAEVNFEKKKLDLGRQQTLRDKKVTSQGQYDDAKAAFDLAEVSLDNAQRNLSYTSIYAPYDAVITSRLLDNYTNISAGTRVVRIQDVSEVQIDINVPETLFARVKESDVLAISASFPAFPGEVFPMEYREHSTEADAVTQTYRVTMAMPYPEDIDLYPGMTASVSVKVRAADHDSGGAFLIPTTAVTVGADSSPFVWVVNDRNSVEKRPVEIGAVTGPFIPVETGLSKGETIIAAGASALIPGQTIRPIQ